MRKATVFFVNFWKQIQCIKIPGGIYIVRFFSAPNKSTGIFKEGPRKIPLFNKIIIMVHPLYYNES